MFIPRWPSVLGVVLVLGAASSAHSQIPATTLAVNASHPLSERVVAYGIDAKYDPKTHSLDATEELTYRNLTGQALDRFPFHLYLNGFQPKATWVEEARRDGQRDMSFEHWEDRERGACEIRSLEVVGMGDLTSRLEFIRPDDGNPEDRTVVQVLLPKAVLPGESIRFRIKFHDQFPETLERTGWKHDFVLGGQWFPKVGVFWHSAWNCHQFHSSTEFFADFGVYDVKLTVPKHEVVGATGLETGSVEHPDGTKTVVYHAEDVHDFAWTACPRYRVLNDSFQGEMGPVRLKIMMQPAHWGQATRHAKILKQTLERFERWYGPYPYKTMTMVDPEPGSAAEGMEYPTFITGGTSWLMPEGLLAPEMVVEHEFGHQYWYGMVATNEFEEAWMDEGINSYTEIKVLDSIFGPRTSILNLWGMTAGDRELQRLSYTGVADFDPMTRKGYAFAGYGSYGGVTYGKTASVLMTLEGIIGEDTLRKALHAYFMRYRFTHPTKDDFLKTVEEVSGRNLRWYFDQAVEGTGVLDYEVAKVRSEPLEWHKQKGKDRTGDAMFRSYVMLHRKGDFTFPVVAEIRFDNGERIREHWDGQDRWIRFTYEKKAQVESVELDPDHFIQLDRNHLNDSFRVKANGAPASKLSNVWTFVTQFFAQALAWWLV